MYCIVLLFLLFTQAMVRLPEILVEEERETHEKASALSANNLLAEVYNNAGLSK